MIHRNIHIDKPQHADYNEKVVNIYAPIMMNLRKSQDDGQEIDVA